MSLTPEQQGVRRRSIGSTDSAAILGLYHPELAHLSKMKNATDVWLRIVHGVDLPASKVMGRGIRVEPLLRTLYRETVGPVDDPPGTLRHSRHPFLVGSPDGLTAGELVEFKSASRWVASQWGPPGTDKVPDAYNLQVQHLMAVCDRPVAVVLAAFGADYEENGTQEFAIDSTSVYVVRRDEALIAEIVHCGARFMAEHVETGISPDMKPLHSIRKWQSLLKQQSNHGAEQ